MPSRRHQGAGLGLAIASSLVKMMGGTVRAATLWGKAVNSVLTLNSELSRMLAPRSQQPTMNALTLLVVAGVLVGLAVVVGLALVFRDSTRTRRRIESIFRRPEKPHTVAGNEEYYRPYWSR